MNDKIDYLTKKIYAYAYFVGRVQSVTIIGGTSEEIIERLTEALEELLNTDRGINEKAKETN